MVYGADYGAAIAEAKGYGWTVEDASFDWPTLRDAIQNEVNRLSGIYSGILEKNAVNCQRQAAKLPQRLFS